MTEFDAGQFDIAVIGAGHSGTRRKPGRALCVQAFLRSKNLGGLRPQARFGAQPPRSGGTWRGDGGIHRTAVGGFAALRMWRTPCECFRRALKLPTGTRVARGNGMERSR